MLLEGLRNWQKVFAASFLYSVDTSDGVFLLQQLLYWNAPLDVIAKVFSHAEVLNTQQISRHLWFFPPALMAADPRSSSASWGLRRPALRKCRLPDALTLAAQQGRSELVQEVRYCLVVHIQACSLSVVAATDSAMAAGRVVGYYHNHWLLLRKHLRNIPQLFEPHGQLCMRTWLTARHQKFCSSSVDQMHTCPYACCYAVCSCCTTSNGQLQQSLRASPTSMTVQRWQWTLHHSLSLTGVAGGLTVLRCGRQ